MNLGYSHQVIVEDTEDIKIEVPDPNKIIISGIPIKPITTASKSSPKDA